MLMHIRKVVSLILIGLALWLFFPIPGPDDMLNIAVGGYISQAFNISLIHGVLLTYTVLPFVILYIGCVISPSPTSQVFHKIINKVKGWAIKFVTDIRLLVAGAVMLIILYFVYVKFISDKIAEMGV